MCRIAQAQIKVGVTTVSATGPCGIAGHPGEEHHLHHAQDHCGQTVEYIVLDDASDTTTAAEEHAQAGGRRQGRYRHRFHSDAHLLAMVDVAAETETPMIAMAASSPNVEPMDDKRRWVFKTPQNDSHMASAVTGHMSDVGVKTLAFIGFNDAYGSGWQEEMTKFAGMRGLKMVASERYARNDTSVTGRS